MVFELFSVTRSPAVAAAPLRVTVPLKVVWDPPTTDVLVSTRPVRAGGWTVNTAV